MSRVTTTELTENQSDGQISANSTLTSWNTASADIDADNIRDEGLDRRNFAANSITRATEPLVYDSGSSETAITDASFTQATIGAAVETGAIVFDSATEYCVIFCSVNVHLTASAGNQPRAELQLGYAINGGADVQLTETLGQYQAGQTNTPLNLDYTVVHRLDEPTVDTGDTVVVKLFRRLATGGGQFTIQRVTLFPEVYRR